MSIFAHLHVHTEYSLVDGLLRIKSLVAAAARARMPALAITDESNLFGAVKFYRAAMQAGVKPILGADLWLLNDKDHNAPSRCVVLCQNQTGYDNLCRLISRGYLEGQYQGRTQIHRDWLAQLNAGLIVLSGGYAGDVGQALVSENHEQLRAALAFWQRYFPGRYYLELVRTGRDMEEVYIALAVALAAREDLPVVASNDTHFLERDDFYAHEARVCIHDGRVLDDPRRPRRYSEVQYLRSPEEMAALFADIPEAITNSVEIAKRCNVTLTLGKNFLPDFPVPEGVTIEEFLAQQARAGLETRLRVIRPQLPDPAAEQAYWDRLALELKVINGMGFPGYFLIVADFIGWAKQNGIPVGPGRGSGAGSLVAYALLITDLDPLKYDLLFERFLNPERVSMPDFDVDFCMERRDEVIDYVAQRYGRDRVSQIITYGSMAAKAVVRDVGRVLGHPYGFVDKIAKMIPNDLGITLDKALEQEEALRNRYQEDEDVRGLLDLARKLEGLTRNAGKHAGGVVIAPSVLTDFCPLYCEAGGTSVVTQFDKDDVEAVGLVKFDFLGLRTLTIIDWAVVIIDRLRAAQGEAPLDITTLPMDDKPTFDLLKDTKTTAVFQLESRGMKDLIKRLQPDCFEDIVALVALFRPGPLQSGMVDDFINRKHGRAKVDYPHPKLEPILKPTYGVILYQEQVMQIAQVLAGYTLGGADLLRRAMGKKKPEEMAKQRAIFTEGAVRNGVVEATATYIFDLMEKFAGYGFNKSHSAAYALVSYQTAWLKAHYPAAFMAATLSADMDNTDKVVTLIDECKSMKLTVQPPDVNLCDYQFTVLARDKILYGIGAIKGVGQAAIDGMLEERAQQGAFASLFDFCRRTSTRKINRRVLEALIKAGAMDALGPNRATLMASLDKALALAEQAARNSSTGQADMFGNGPVTTRQEADYVAMQEWGDDDRLTFEKETLGLYLTGHPIVRYEKELAKIISCRIADLNPTKNQLVTIAGLVVAMRAMKTRKGDRMLFVTLDDRSGRIELAVFPDLYQQSQDLLAKDKLLIVEGEVSMDDYTGGYKMSARTVYDMARIREIYGSRIILRIQEAYLSEDPVQELRTVLYPHRGGSCHVLVEYQTSRAAVRLRLGADWQVEPADALVNRLIAWLGPDNVEMEYRKAAVEKSVGGAAGGMAPFRRRSKEPVGKIAKNV